MNANLMDLAAQRKSTGVVLDKRPSGNQTKTIIMGHCQCRCANCKCNCFCAQCKASL